MIEAAQDAHVSCHPDGTIMTWNRAAIRMFGYSKNIAVGQSHFLLFPERHRSLIAALVSETSALSSPDAPEFLDLVALKADGTEFSVELSLSGFEQNGLIFFMLVIRDVSSRRSIDKEQRGPIETKVDLELLNSRVSQKTKELKLAHHYSETQEERYTTILNQLPAGIATIRATDLIYTSVNREYTALHGNRSLVGHSILEFLVTPESMRFVEILKNVISTGVPFTAKEVLRKVGQTGVDKHDDRYFNLVYDPIFNSEKVVTDIFVFCFDVTDSVLARRAIEVSETLFRTLTETLPQIVWMADFNGNILHFNKTWYDFTGVDRSRVHEFEWSSLIHPDDLIAVRDEGIKARAANRGFELAYRIRRHDGVYRWHLARSITLQSSEGQEGRRIGTATDIHDQREAQKTIADLKHRTDSVIQDAPVLLWAVDKEGVFTYYDGRLCRTLGISTSDRIGKNILDIHRGNEHIAGCVLRAMKGEVVRDESEIGNVSLENKFTPQYDNEGNINGVVGLSIDITERKLVEKRLAEVAMSAKIAQESTKLKSDFLATMSHEIRTPINGVIGMAGLLLDMIKGQEELSYVAAIQRSGENLLNIVNDILDFSKIEANKIEFEHSPFVLADVFADLQKTTLHSVSEKELKLAIELQDNLPLHVTGDAGRMTQVVLNLVSNAIKFTKKGQITVRVSSIAKTINRHKIKVEIIDSGIGISPETLAKLFQPFTQADASTARRYGGTGLGLSICKGLVEQMGGEIGALSDVGVGSNFWFTIPFKVVEIKPDELRTESEASEDRSVGAKILLAEDNHINQIVAVKMLEKMGYKVDVVVNGREALYALAKTHYDLVLMDCQMPEMDGYEATREIRASRSLPNPKIPVIAMTANAMEGDAEKCMAAGMSDYVSKPVKPNTLQDIIRKNLRIKIQGQTA